MSGGGDGSGSGGAGTSGTASATGGGGSGAGAGAGSSTAASAGSTTGTGAGSGSGVTATGAGGEQTVERTVTESDTVVVTETTEEPPDRGAPAPSGESGAELNDRGFQLLQQGDAEGALPLLEEAVSRLGGSSSLAEAYASYNLAVARFANGSCDGVAELLDRSEEIQGRRKEIDRLRKQVEKRCGE